MHIKTPVVVNAVSGKMGQAIARGVLQNPDFKLVGALVREGHPWLGNDLGDCLGLKHASIEVSPHIHTKDRPVVIDFSLPGVSLNMAELCADKKYPMVIGTTGFTQSEKGYLKEFSKYIPMLYSPNMSLLANWLMYITKLTKTRFPELGAAISEIHHVHKKDNPSGTAKALAQCASYEGEIRGIRGGESIGEHTVYFFGHQERLELTHRAYDRELFAKGALEASVFIKDQKPGFYGMEDVLGLKVS